MRPTALLLIVVTSTLTDAATVKSICASDVVIGKPAELTCEIDGVINFAINWYRSDRIDPIVSCKKKSGTCISSLYSETNLENNIQKFTIPNVSEDDLTRTWTCVDGTLSSPDKDECKLTLKAAETTADCDRGNLNVGKPFTISCDIKGTVVKGINWFRDGQNFVVCNKTNGECETKTGAYKIETINNNRYQFTILDVTEDDLRKTWTCVDGTTTGGIQGCSLIRLIEEATGASIGSSFTVAVILVIVDVIIYVVCKDNLSKVKKIYIIYCVVDVLVVGIVCGVSIYYIYLRTSDIGIIAGTCIGFLVVSTVIKIIVVKTELFSKCS